MDKEERSIFNIVIMLFCLPCLIVPLCSRIEEMDMTEDQRIYKYQKIPELGTESDVIIISCKEKLVVKVNKKGKRGKAYYRLPASCPCPKQKFVTVILWWGTNNKKKCRIE